MNVNIRCAAYIPLKTRILIIDDYYPNAQRKDWASYVELFNIYREYIATDPKTLSLNCESCQSKVMSAFSQIVNHWTNG